MGWGGIRTKSKASHTPFSSHPAPRSSKHASLGGCGEENCTLMVFLPALPASRALLPARRSPSGRPLGGRPPSPLVSRCLQATEPQSAHCLAGAGRPAGPWRRITGRPTPVRESFPGHSVGYKTHFLRDGEGMKIHLLLSLLQFSSLSLFRISERDAVKRIKMGRWLKM